MLFQNSVSGVACKAVRIYAAWALDAWGLRLRAYSHQSVSQTMDSQKASKVWKHEKKPHTVGFGVLFTVVT